jgi:hypothetical protein
MDFFLKLTDLQNQTEYIVMECDKSDFKHHAKELYDKLKIEYDNKINGECDTTRYSLTENSCDVYCLKPIVKQGYIWKSLGLQRIDLYKMTLVEKYMNYKNNKSESQPEKIMQHGFGYSSNIVTTQFPLTSFPVELSKELESKLKLLRESYIVESESDTESNIDTESDTDTDTEIIIKKKMS